MEINKKLSLPIIRHLGLLISIALIATFTTYSLKIAAVAAILVLFFLLESYNKNLNLYLLMILIPLPLNTPIANFEVSLSIPFILVCYLIKFFMHRKEVDKKINKFDVFALVFLIIGVFPLANSIGSELGWANGYIKFFLVPVLFYFYIRFYYKDFNSNYKLIFGGIMVSLAVYCSYALFEFFVVNQSAINFVGDSEYRLSGGILGQGNGLAMNLEKIFPFIILFLLNKSKKDSLNSKTFLFFIMLFFISVLFLSLSRGGWISLAILSILILIYYKKIVYLFYIFALIIFSVFTIEPIRTRLFTDESTLFFRTDLWSMSMKIIKENFLFGIPFNDFVYYYEHNFNTVISLSRTHNIIMDILVFSGIIGFLYFSILLIFIISNVRKILKSNVDNAGKIITVGFLLMIVNSIIHGMIDSPMFSFSRDVFVWIEFAMFASILNRKAGMKRETF